MTEIRLSTIWKVEEFEEGKLKKDLLKDIKTFLIIHNFLISQQDLI